VNCFYASSGLNYKNGWATCCPRQSDQLKKFGDVKPSTLFHSREFRALRAKLKRGHWPKGCHLCKESEEIGHPSMREDWEWKDDNLRHVELRFSNSCNMACLHCSEVYSSGWERKLSKYEPTFEAQAMGLSPLLGTMHRNGPSDNTKMQLSMSQMVEIVEDLNENFPYLEMVDFAGGEVTYQKQFFPCLELLAKHPNKDLRISFHTNFNADFDVKTLHTLLQPFGETTITISLDAGRNIYSYFRDGNWDKMVSNLEEFVSYGKLGYIEPTCTTSVYQMLDFYNVWEDFLSLEHLVTGYNASIVQTPRWLDPAVLMHDFKREIESEIKRTEELVKHNWSAARWVSYIEEYVLYKKTPYNDYNRFLVYINETDKLWKQDFNDYYKRYGYNKDGELFVRNT